MAFRASLRLFPEHLVRHRAVVAVQILPPCLHRLRAAPPERFSRPVSSAPHGGTSLFRGRSAVRKNTAKARAQQSSSLAAPPDGISFVTLSMPDGGVMSVFTAPFVVVARLPPELPVAAVTVSVPAGVISCLLIVSYSNHVFAACRTPCRGDLRRVARCSARKTSCAHRFHSASLRTSPLSACRSSVFARRRLRKSNSVSGSAAHSTDARQYLQTDHPPRLRLPPASVFIIPPPCAYKFPQILPHFLPFHRNLPCRASSRTINPPSRAARDRLNTG